MEIITNDLPQHGVLIHGPESPGFRDRLFALVTVPPELEDEALRYSIVVENQTPQHILQIMLVWRPYPQKGWPLPFYEGAGVSIDPVFNNVSGSLIKPGGQCPWSIPEGHGFWRQKAVIAPPQPMSDRKRGERRRSRQAPSGRRMTTECYSATASSPARTWPCGLTSSKRVSEQRGI